MTSNTPLRLGPVYGWVAAALLSALSGVAAPVMAQNADAAILDARDAFGRKDRNRLAAARAVAAAAEHPLAMWVEYWELNLRLADAQQDDLEAFYRRWPGSYVEDRLRNDWLLELGKRRDWANFAADYPRFRMNDDREVSCWALLTEHLTGKDVRDTALAAWLAQREADDGCALLASTLTDARLFGAADAWRKARRAIDASRPRAARQAAALVSPSSAAALAEMLDSPARYLAKKASATNRASAEVTALALARIAANEPEVAAAQLDERWDRTLPADLAAWAWGLVGKQAAMKLQPEAPDHFRRAASRAGSAEIDWPADMLAWKVRAALRADNGRPRWQQVVQAIDAMPAAEQRDPAWVYWKARGLRALAKDSQDGEALHATAREMLAGLAAQMNFYAKLAAEDLGRPITLPPAPGPLAAEEREAAARHPGLKRALQLAGLGLRDEGRREWNFSLRGMDDRSLLAAAALACRVQDWQLCINTSERTRTEIDVAQRFPMPFKDEIGSHARDQGLDPAYVFGLIRQETRFMPLLRSSVGASGLMQLMPATARETARKIGMTDYSADMITDRDTNLRLGTSYLKRVLDDFGGSQALAAAAYNAGPNRPRRWREGPVLEPAAWAENIPFSETRDYVKKVLSNATYYAVLLGREAPSLKARLGRTIGPRDANQPSIDKDLP